MDAIRVTMTTTAKCAPVRVHYWDGTVREFSRVPQTVEEVGAPLFMVKHVEVTTVTSGGTGGITVGPA